MLLSKKAMTCNSLMNAITHSFVFQNFCKVENKSLLQYSYYKRKDHEGTDLYFPFVLPIFKQVLKVTKSRTILLFLSHPPKNEPKKPDF